MVAGVPWVCWSGGFIAASWPEESGICSGAFERCLPGLDPSHTEGQGQAFQHPAGGPNTKTASRLYTCGREAVQEPALSGGYIETQAGQIRLSLHHNAQHYAGSGGEFT